MNKTVLLAALGLVATGTMAQEVGRVVSTTPIVQQVAVPRQVCQPGVAPGQTTGGGGVAGALIGGGIGNLMGEGSRGRPTLTLLGALGGAIIGNQVEAQNSAARGQPVCTTENVMENRTVAYNVTYEYQGQQYTVQMPNDPGPTVRLQAQAGATTAPVTQGNVMPSNVVTAPPVAGTAYPAPQVIAAAPQVYAAPQVIAAPQVVVPAEVVYPAYYPYYRPYYAYPPVSLSIGLGYSYWGGGHRHWRH